MIKTTMTEHHDTQPVICLINLGCAKNQTDAECILGQLAQQGCLITGDPESADICLVNTCGFIHDAREEVREVLEELADLRESGTLQYIVALGCMVERAAVTSELSNVLNHADMWVGFAEYPKLAQLCLQLYRHELIPTQGFRTSETSKQEGYKSFITTPRVRISAPHLANLKISEGCSNHCTFCSIPLIRGKQVSRPIDDILSEARGLIDAGAVEIDIIAQDSSSYGKDLYKQSYLSTLLKELADMDNAIWYRLMYVHPAHLEESVLEILTAESCFCHYIDMPLQHIADPVLKRMGRKLNQQKTMDLLANIRKNIPDAAIRSAFITGFPGETEENHQELLAFIREGWFRHLGVFTYSEEPGTAAAAFSDDVPNDVKYTRREELMMAQLEVSRKHLTERVGKTEMVMIDELLTDNNYSAIGRTQKEAPEVDGVILIKKNETINIQPGDMINGKMIEALDYDMVADIVS